MSTLKERLVQSVDLCAGNHPDGPTALIDACVEVMTYFTGPLTPDQQKGLVQSLIDFHRSIEFYIDDTTAIQEVETLAQAQEATLQKIETIQKRRTLLKQSLPLCQDDENALRAELEVLEKLAQLEAVRKQMTDVVHERKAYADVLRAMAARVPMQITELKDLDEQIVILLERQKDILRNDWVEKEGKTRQWEKIL